MQHDHHDQPAAAATPAVAIEVRNVSKTFALGQAQSSTIKDWVIQRATRGRREPDRDTGEIRALKQLSFDIHQRETFGILGHNGSGKSTLLKIMAGVVRPSTGQIRARGTMSALLELGAGFHPDLTGRENIFLNASILGFSRDYVRDIYDEIVEFSEIGDFIDLQTKFYSSGMRARLGFSVATNLKPDVLLVDEVLAVGDEKFQAKCMERVQNFRSTNHTMVMVSHGPERVRDLCDRAAVLDHGRLLFVGDADEAIKVYRTALYGTAAKPGRPPGKAGSSPAAEDKNGQQPKPTGQAGNETGNDDNDTIDGFALTGASVDDSGRDGGVFKPGDNVPFRVNFQSDTERRVHLVAIIRGRNGEVVIRRSTAQTIGAPMVIRPGRHHAAFTLHDLPLLDDVYSFAFVARDADTRDELDRITGGPNFTVEGPGAHLGRVVANITYNDPANSESDTPKSETASSETAKSQTAKSEPEVEVADLRPERRAPSPT